MKTDINNLYKDLKKRITSNRLKEISIDVISKYKAKNHNALLGYARLLGIDESGSGINKIFAQIIQKYHPDKINKIHSDIETVFSSGNLDELIRIRDRFLFTKPPREVVNNIYRATFDAEYESDIDEEYSYSDDDFGYDEERTYTNEETEYSDDEFDDEDEFSGSCEYGFMEAIHSVLFGNLDVTLSTGDLINLDGEIDLSDMEIINLDGIEYCIYIQSLNLSGNSLIKIDQLGMLSSLEYLFISENRIESIDCLAELGRLKELDISFNEIEDISVLLKLENLVYVNILGNPIHDTHVIKTLSDRGVIVIS